jgi:hypothetical protein
MGTAVSQRAELTFKGNRGVSRHDWLRLTPAYSARLVHDVLKREDTGLRVLDPFGGSATTGLLAAERGHRATSVDLNPFLCWFADVKTANYADSSLSEVREMADICTQAASSTNQEPWLPSLFNIERWWSATTLNGLGTLRAEIFQLPVSPVRDLLLVSFARTMIGMSNAAFNHQSMSFKQAHERLRDRGREEVFSRFRRETDDLIVAATPLQGSVAVIEGDGRSLLGVEDNSHDVLCTSPPYANRMSYIRELRPYMYWLGFLTEAREAGELDWQAIGGTWGIATSRVSVWEPEGEVPLGVQFTDTLSGITAANERSGDVLSRYVAKYFHDIWAHVRASFRVMRHGGRVTYVVGNSTFRGVHVPTHEWYAQLLTEAGFENAVVTVLRKRNSNKALYEYAVAAAKPRHR